MSWPLSLPQQQSVANVGKHLCYFDGYFAGKDGLAVA